MRDPAGQNLVLTHGAHRAEVVTVGACLRSLNRDGIDLVAGWPVGEMAPSSRGAVMMPWVNRVGDGRYDFGGRTLQLALSEPAKHNAIHGLVHWVPWTVADQADDRVLLTYALPPQAGYPWPLDLEVDHRLGDDGLTTTLSATNVGTEAAPYGSGLHPYLTVGRRVDECVLTLPADTWCAMDERGLPAPAVPVDGTEWDFRGGRAIGDLVVDHPYGGVADGATATLTDPDTGRSASVTVHEGIGWLHVFTGDTIRGHEREALAVEPVTAPPDSFRTGVDLVVLEPGATHRASFTIAGSGPA
ncbi:aldose 1-epimerase family protein [Nocardioides mangrovi]|uniref:Aldose 1-epimerase family protein n=1 Tax=Nocardioides mangrovi TaxID=2874580 RepID=A0ABS7U8Q2_9ACTN|nr:aldose 1-epimerase family protein [Nocardioides mangrovi]MBZ5737207.1 aldose 1-epimerase family protein [Nocardioides mangrovi]